MESDVTACLGGACIFLQRYVTIQCNCGCFYFKCHPCLALSNGFPPPFTALGRQGVGCWASTCSSWCCFIAPWHPLNQSTSQAFLRASPTPFIFLFLSFPRKKLDSRGTPGWLACLEKEFLSFPQAQMRLTGTPFQTILILGKV